MQELYISSLSSSSVFMTNFPFMLTKGGPASGFLHGFSHWCLKRSKIVIYVSSSLRWNPEPLLRGIYFWRRSAFLVSVCQHSGSESELCSQQSILIETSNRLLSRRHWRSLGGRRKPRTQPLSVWIYMYTQQPQNYTHVYKFEFVKIAFARLF